MRPGQKFSRHRVVELKQAMLLGAGDTALARIEKVAANTIRRMRLGETYADVVVEGEESLRPAIDISYVGTGEQVAQRTVARPVEMVPDDEIEAMGQRMMNRQERMAEAPKALAGKEPDASLTEEELKAKARQFGAL